MSKIFEHRTDRAPAAPVEVNPTLWGYVIRSRRRDFRRGGLAGWTRRALGAGMAVLALGQWAGPGAMTDPSILVLKFGATIFFALVSVLLLWPRREWATREVQIDMNRGQISAGTRNGRGDFVLEGQLGFEEISTVMLARGEDGDDACRLLCRLIDTDRALVVAEGTRDALAPLAARLGCDLGAIQAGFNPVARSDPRAPLLLGPNIDLATA